MLLLLNSNVIARQASLRAAWLKSGPPDTLSRKVNFIFCQVKNKIVSPTKKILRLPAQEDRLGNAFHVILSVSEGSYTVMLGTQTF